ncbi:MAG: hypothetical protein QM796_22905 [Chthoniobacteraceae bacterium]
MKTFVQLLKWMAIGGGVLVALAVVFVCEENWRGAHTWAQYRTQLEKQGFGFTVEAIRPKPVPESQNFATSPLLRPLFDYEVDRETGQERLRDESAKEKIEPSSTTVKALFKPAQFGNFRTAEVVDLDSAKCAQILQALSQYEPQMREIATNARRPFAVYPVRYEDGVSMKVGFLSVLQGFIGAYDLRAKAEIGVGQMEAAKADVETILRIAGKCQNPSILISGLVRNAFLICALEPMWIGLQRHGWSEAQLAEMQQMLAGIDVIRLSIVDLRTEMESVPMGEKTLTALPLDKRKSMLTFWREDELAEFLEMLPITGWIDQNTAFQLRWEQERTLKELDPVTSRVFPKKVEADIAAANALQTTPYNFRARQSLAVISTCNRRTAMAAQYVKLAEIGCALERYRLVHHEYPEALANLVPEFMAKLSSDVCTGEPLHYRRETTASYRLWSVGWDLLDDDGVAKTSDSGVFDSLHGDWVWKIPNPASDTTENGNSKS